MAGGQSASFGQGSLSESADVPLVGLETTGATGTVVVEAAPEEEALTGEFATWTVGDAGNLHLVPLRSRKSTTGSASYVLSGMAVSMQDGIIVREVGSALTGFVSTLAQGAFQKQSSKLLTGVQFVGASGVMSGGQPAQPWDVGDITVMEGATGQSAGQFSVVATGPFGYATGGIYDTSSGTQLPTGATMSEGGLLDVGSAAVGTTNGVIFAYTEPNALPVLTLHSGALSGQLPYMATVYPCEGAVPAGMTLVSPVSTTTRGSVISTWPDGSAQVMVVAGHKSGILANSTLDVTLRPAVISEAALTPAHIDSLLNDLVLNFGTSQTFNNWTSPTRIWWANSQVICARYHIPITGKGALEAVVDIHAFALGRVFAEFVIENGKIDTSVASPTKPAAQQYTNATITLNGVVITSTGVSSPAGELLYAGHTNPPVGSKVIVKGIKGTPPSSPVNGDTWAVGRQQGDGNAVVGNGLWLNKDGAFATWNSSSGLWEFTARTPGFHCALSATATQGYTYRSPGAEWSYAWAGWHEAFRAWYCSGWIGGDPLIDVTHDTVSLQAHPMFWKTYTALTYNQAPYAAFPYVPWVTSWHCDFNMEGTGETGRHGMTFYVSSWIGPFSPWECAYIGSGSKESRYATLAAAKEHLRSAINYRDTTTNIAPSSTQCMGHDQSVGTFPRTTSQPNYEDAHQPSQGLIPFLCHPSPCWIEQAQKAFAWNHTVDSPNGRYLYKQPRGRAWTLRCYYSAIFLTPDAQPADPLYNWKESARTVLGATHADTDPFRVPAWNTLGLIYGLRPDQAGGPPDYQNWDQSDRVRFQRNLWMQHWFAIKAYRMLQAKVLRDPVKIAAWESTTDWLLSQPIRYINDCDPTSGTWRLQNYMTTYGDVGPGATSVNMGDGSWQHMLESDYTGTPPANAGTFLFINHDTGFDWSAAGNVTGLDTSTYASPFWTTLVCARERGTPGAQTAYERVITGITNLYTTYLPGGAREPRYNCIPRL